MFDDVVTLPPRPSVAPRHPALRSVAELQQRVERQSFASPFGAELKQLLLRGAGDLIGIYWIYQLVDSGVVNSG